MEFENLLFGNCTTLWNCTRTYLIVHIVLIHMRSLEIKNTI